MTAATANALEQARAGKLVAIFDAIDAALENKEPKVAAIRRLAAVHHGTAIAALDGQTFTLKLSYQTLYRLYAAYKAHGQTASIMRRYHRGRAAIPRDLVAEIRRRALAKGAPTTSVAVKQLLKEWENGASIPGLGTWREWYATKYPDQSPPDRAPKFPYHPSTLYKYAPARQSALGAAGNLGVAAMRNHLMAVVRDSSLVKPGELYVLDDVRLDLVCHEDLTGRLTEVRAYVMMDWGTRRVVGWTMRAGNALNESDVRALIARGLHAGGIRPPGEVTHIILERGTVALNDAAVELIHALSEGRVKIHRTSMISGETWTGAGKDKPVGNFKGKAVLESFFRRLHIRLGHLNGQRGNRYEAQPASLDFAGQNTARRPGTKQQLDEALAQLDRLHGGRLKIKLAALYEREVADEFGQAIKDHNAARGHGMQGFGTVTVATDANGNQYDVPADILLHNPPEITVYPPQAGHPTEGSPCK